MELPYTDLLSDVILKLVSSILIIIIGLVIGRFIGKLTQKILNNLQLNRILKSETNIKILLEEALASILKYVIYFISLIAALNQLGLAPIVFTIILIIVLVFMVFFIILALKDFIPNIMAGFVIHQKGFIKKNDYIRVKSVEGRIEQIGLTEVKLITKNKDVVFVPNITLVKNEVIKYKK